MNQNNLLGPILIRFGFFVLNLYFTIRMTSVAGWSFFSVILAIFATREFVGAIQMGQVYIHLKKYNEKKNDNNPQ